MGILTRLRPLHKVITNFFVLDVETKVTYEEWVHQRKAVNPHFVVPPKSKNPKAIYWGLKGRPENFVFGVIHGYNYTQIFYSLPEMLHALKTDQRFKNKLIFGHNVTYDLNTMFGNIFFHDPEAIFNGGRFMCCMNHGDNGKFADSMNVLGKVPLKKIGEMIGKAKPELGEDFFSPNGLTASEINRCTTDCEITYDALSHVFNSGGDIKITGPSLALSNFRRYFMDKAIEYNDLYNHRFFESYYGGRTEAFKIGHTHAHVIDRNSMYPAKMKEIEFPHPRDLKEITIIKTKDFINKILPHYEGQITCTVHHRNHKFGFLPVRYADKLLFPVGTFKGTWCFPEIRFALEQGVIDIRSIDSVLYAPPMVSPFVRYVDHYYSIKTTATDYFEIDRVKHLLNDLYGKFGQKVASETIYIKDLDDAVDMLQDLQAEGRLIKIQRYNGERNDAIAVLKGKGGFKVKHAIPCIAAYITSTARVDLLAKMLEYQNRNVVYCDTDSVFFEINPGVVSEKHLGGWKLEDKIITHIRGLKNYSYYQTTGKQAGIVKDRIKGVPSKATCVDGVWQYENLLQTKEALRRGLDAGVSVLRKKVLKGTYDKRIVYSNGETEAITLTL